jgi:hypothetical protein
VGTSSIATYTDEFTTTSALSGGGIYFLALMLEELAPENAWHTTPDWNPDAEAGWAKRVRCWLRGVVPAAVL